MHRQILKPEDFDAQKHSLLIWIVSTVHLDQMPNSSNSSIIYSIFLHQNVIN